MAELRCFETCCKENCILRKTTLKFIIQIFMIFRKKMYFETLYAQKYSEKERSGSTSDRSTRF